VPVTAPADRAFPWSITRRVRWPALRLEPIRRSRM